MAHRVIYGRSLARSQALQLLFQAEMSDMSVDEVLADNALVVDPLDESGDHIVPLSEAKGVSLDEYGREKPLDEYSSLLALGVEEHLEELDGIIAERSDAWALERMPLVDRNLMRIALFEMFYVPEVATATAIDECVELAKMYGSEDTPGFVNGVLGRVADQLEQRE